MCDDAWPRRLCSLMPAPVGMDLEFPLEGFVEDRGQQRGEFGSGLGLEFFELIHLSRHWAFTVSHARAAPRLVKREGISRFLALPAASRR